MPRYEYNTIYASFQSLSPITTAFTTLQSHVLRSQSAKTRQKSFYPSAGLRQPNQTLHFTSAHIRRQHRTSPPSTSRGDINAIVRARNCIIILTLPRCRFLLLTVTLMPREYDRTHSVRLSGSGFTSACMISAEWLLARRRTQSRTHTHTHTEPPTNEPESLQYVCMGVFFFVSVCHLNLRAKEQ